MVGDVNMQSLLTYLQPDAVPNMPKHCQVLGLSHSCEA